MAESPALILLHHIMTEISGVKSQWEALIDRMSQGYGDAYRSMSRRSRSCARSASSSRTRTARR